MRALADRFGRDGFAGLFVLLAGLVVLLLVRDYPRGRLSEFGPGMVPFAGSIGMILLGAAMLLRARRSDAAEPLATGFGRPLFLIPLGMAIFAFGLNTLGLALVSALAVFVASFASPEPRLFERVLVALGLAALVTLVFGYGLAMTMPLWPLSR